MKLTKDQKRELKTLREMASESGIKVIQIPIYGLTIGWYRPFPESKMVVVATSYLLETMATKFRTKTGQYFVLQRLFDLDGKGQTMQLPLGMFNDADVADILESVFSL
jgi:hypothetical protein